MAHAIIRLYAALNDFLPAQERGSQRTVRTEPHQSVKDVLEALGVPHVEVEALLIDGVPSKFDERLHDSARVAAYPAFQSLGLPDELCATPPLHGEPKFVVDGNLATLARHLRLLGLDAELDPELGEAALAIWAAEDNRVLLSRDRGILKRAILTHGYWPRTDDPQRQLAEVVARFQLRPFARPFARCLRCNGVLHDVPKFEVQSRVPPYTFQTHDRFRECERCAQVYWSGTHQARLEALLADVLPTS